jgi:hypothetical protein
MDQTDEFAASLLIVRQAASILAQVLYGYEKALYGQETGPVCGPVSCSCKRRI